MGSRTQPEIVETVPRSTNTGSEWPETGPGRASRERFARGERGFEIEHAYRTHEVVIRLARCEAPAGSELSVSRMSTPNVCWGGIRGGIFHPYSAAIDSDPVDKPVDKFEKVYYA